MKIAKKILIFVILTLIPVAIGLPFRFGFDRKVIFEVTMAVFGLLELLVLMVRIFLKDRKLYKKGISSSEFKESDNYKNYVNIQIILLVSAVINLLISLLYFYIFIRQ